MVTPDDLKKATVRQWRRVGKGVLLADAILPRSSYRLFRVRTRGKARIVRGARCQKADVHPVLPTRPVQRGHRHQEGESPPSFESLIVSFMSVVAFIMVVVVYLPQGRVMGLCFAVFRLSMRHRPLETPKRLTRNPAYPKRCSLRPLSNSRGRGIPPSRTGSVEHPSPLWGEKR